MKKILFSLGSVSVVAAPFAALVSCGDKKVEAPFKATTRTDADIAKDLTDWVNNSFAVGASVSFGANRSIGGQLAPSNATVPVDWTNSYWNKPEGETFRLAAITTAIGNKIWGFNVVGLPSSADIVIRAILFGVISDLNAKNELEKNVPNLNKNDIDRIKKSISSNWDKLATDPKDNTKPLFADQAAFEAWVDSFLGKSYNEINKAISDAKITKYALLHATSKEEVFKKLASNKLNYYKVELIKNIEAKIKEFDATSSLQKFDGFINWFIDSKDNYKNLRETLISGKITPDFIQGIQDELNKPTDTLIELASGRKSDIVIINPTP